jgi:hypothetical protein
MPRWGCSTDVKPGGKGAHDLIPEDLEALALADSIGVLDQDERAELNARRAALSPEDQAEIARLYETASALATAVMTDPPTHVRDRMLSALRTPPRPNS